MKHKKNLLLCLIAILAIFSIVSCGGDNLPEPGDGGGSSSGTTEIFKATSNNLDAWRAACNKYNSLEHKSSKTIDVTVTGTVATYTKYETYLVDETGGMAIHAELTDIAVGDKVTVTTKKIKNFHNILQAETVTYTKVESSNAPTPKSITNITEFTNLATANTYDFVTVTGRVMNFDTDGNAIIAIYEKEPTAEELKALTAEKLLEFDAAEGIPVTSKSAKLKLGSVYKITGHITPSDTSMIITSFDGQTEELHEYKLTPETKTVAEYQTFADKKTDIEYLLNPYQVTARLLKMEKKDAIILDESGNAIHLHSNINYISNKIEVEATTPENKEAEPIYINPGDEVVVNLENIAFHDGNLQCTSFEFIEKTAKEKMDEQKMLAKATNITSFKSLTEFKDYQNKRNLVKIVGTVSSTPTDYGFTMKISDTDKPIYIASSKSSQKVGNEIIVYGCLAYDGHESTNYENTPTVSPNIIQTTKEVTPIKENSTFADFKALKNVKEHDLNPYLQVKGVVILLNSKEMILYETATGDVIHCNGNKNWNETKFIVGDEVVVNLTLKGNRYGKNLVCKDLQYVETSQQAKFKSSDISTLGKIITKEEELVFSDNVETDRDLVNIDAFFVKKDGYDLMFSFEDPKTAAEGTYKTYRIQWSNKIDLIKGDKIHITGCLANNTDSRNPKGHVLTPAYVVKITE